MNSAGHHYLRATVCVGLGLLLAGPAIAQVAGRPAGAYRTAAAYRHHQPQPAGADAFYPDKRSQVVVVVPRGPETAKLRVSPDSAWGYVSARGQSFRLYRGEEYRLDQADTLCVYSTSFVVVNGLRVGAAAGRRYFFSRGLTGLIFPLTSFYLREAYGASNPAFAAALKQLPASRSLTDYDRKTGLYRVTSLYRQTAPPTH